MPVNSTCWACQFHGWGQMNWWLLAVDSMDCLSIPWPVPFPKLCEQHNPRPGPKLIKKISCGTKLSMILFLLKNVKNANYCWHFNIYEQEKKSILGLSEPEKCWISWYFYTYEQLKFYAKLSWASKCFYNLGSRLKPGSSLCCSYMHYINIQHAITPFHTYCIYDINIQSTMYI